MGPTKILPANPAALGPPLSDAVNDPELALAQGLPAGLQDYVLRAVNHKPDPRSTDRRGDGWDFTKATREDEATMRALLTQANSDTVLNKTPGGRALLGDRLGTLFDQRHGAWTPEFHRLILAFRAGPAAFQRALVATAPGQSSGLKRVTGLVEAPITDPSRLPK